MLSLYKHLFPGIITLSPKTAHKGSRFLLVTISGELKGKLNVCLVSTVSCSSVTTSVSSLGFSGWKAGMCSMTSEIWWREGHQEGLLGGRPLYHLVRMAEKPSSVPQPAFLFFMGCEAVSSFNSFWVTTSNSFLNSFPMSSLAYFGTLSNSLD